MEQLADELDAVFRKNTLNKTLTKRTKDFWASSIYGGQKSKCEFIKYIISHPDYIDAKMHEFHDIALAEEVTRDNTTDVAFMSMLKAREDIMCESDIVFYVRSMPLCVANWTNIVMTVHGMVNNSSDTTMLPSEVNHYIELWKSNRAFGVAELRSSMEKQPITQSAPLLLAVVSQASQAPQTVETRYSKDIVNGFEAAFGRMMYVHEYFRYSPEYLKSSSKADVFNGIFSQHTRRYQRINSIVEKYIGAPMDEYTFVREHIDASDKGDVFYKQFEDDLLNSKAYKDVISSKLSTIHDDMYDAAIEKREMEFLFKRIQAIKCGLDDEALVDKVTEFKSERDDILTSIGCVYNSVFYREPDLNEVDEAIVMYRSSKTSSADMELELLLCASYEFHEIIKAKLKELYAASRDQDVIMPSILYALLGKLLTSGTCRTVQAMHEACQKAINSITAGDTNNG